MSSGPRALEVAVTELLPAASQLMRRLRLASADLSLSWSDVAVIARLDRHGPATISELARAESYTASAMGITMAELEQRGQVERQSDPKDKRLVLFSLTEAGRDTRQKCHISHREWALVAAARLSKSEQKALIAAVPLIARIAEA